MSTNVKVLVSILSAFALGALTACNPGEQSGSITQEVVEKRLPGFGACTANTGFWGIGLESEKLGISKGEPLYIDANYQTSRRVLNRRGELTIYVSNEGLWTVQSMLKNHGKDGHAEWDQLSLDQAEVQHRSFEFTEGSGAEAYAGELYQAVWTAPSGVVVGLSLTTHKKYSDLAREGFNELLDGFCWVPPSADPQLFKALAGIWKEVGQDGVENGASVVVSPDKIEFVGRDGFVQKVTYDTKSGRLNLFDEGHFSASYGVSFNSEGMIWRRPNEVFYFSR